MVANSVFNSVSYGIIEYANQGSDYNAMVANASTSNTSGDPDNVYQVVKNGPNSFEEHNIKKYAL